MTYPLALSDSQWLVIAPLLPRKSGGTYPMRSIICALFYLTKTGCQWRALPPHFPPWQTVYYHFRRLSDMQVISSLMLRMGAMFRILKGRTARPTAAIVDSQSVRTGAGVSTLKGWDGAKKINSRKRHLVTDTLGLPLMLMISGGELKDRAGLAMMSVPFSGPTKGLKSFTPTGLTGASTSRAASEPVLRKERM